MAKQGSEKLCAAEVEFPDCKPGPNRVRLREKPGDTLRRMRTRLGISARDVEVLSQDIATQQRKDEFLISRGRIIQMENDATTPSIYKLCSLSAIYGVPLSEIVALFVDLPGLARSARGVPHDRSRVVRLESPEPAGKVAFPVRFSPCFSPDHTNLLSRVVQAWGEIPIEMIQHLNLRAWQYGMIGLADYTLYPLLKPGSFVQIDTAQRKVTSSVAANEYERPIYFVELRDGFLCGWCELQNGRLSVVPHPLSPCKVRSFAVPAEAEVLGRVVAIAGRVVSTGDGAGQGESLRAAAG